MRRTDRLFELIQIFRDGRLKLGRDLAAQLGVSLRTLYRDIENYNVGSCLGMLCVDVLLWFVIFYYLDQVVPHSVGVPRKPWFFLTRDFWLERCGVYAAVPSAAHDAETGSSPTGNGAGTDMPPAPSLKPPAIE